MILDFNVAFPKKPYPLGSIFDPIRGFHPEKFYNQVLEKCSNRSLRPEIEYFLVRVFSLHCQVYSLSCLYSVWMKNVSSTGILTDADKSMTYKLFQMHDHVDMGKRYNAEEDRVDPNVIPQISHHSQGYTGCSLDDFNCVNRDPKCNFKKQFAEVFKKWPYKQFENQFLNPIQGICDAIYQGMVLLLFTACIKKYPF